MDEVTCRNHNYRWAGALGFDLADMENGSDNARKEQALSVLRARMIANGWCCHQVEHLSRIHNIKSFVYLAMRPRPSTRRVDHNGCLRQATCVAYNIDESIYETRHVRFGCTCPILSVPHDDLIRIARAGQVPLVTIERDASSDPNYQLRLTARKDSWRSSKSSRYVAISHVWSDGLGNPNGNGLPLCQVKRLESFLTSMKALYTERGPNRQPFSACKKFPMLFWMDTLCVPVLPNNRMVRLMQIGRMASIYKGAVACLVIDAALIISTAASVTFGLFDPPSRRVSPSLNHETLSNLSSSVWMCRGWTFQEARLATAIAIRFQNGTVILRQEGGRLRSQILYDDSRELETVDQPMQSTIESDADVSGDTRAVDSSISSHDLADIGCDCLTAALERTLNDVLFGPQIFDPGLPPIERESVPEFAPVWNELAGRSATRSTDYLWIMATTLDFDLRSLLKNCNRGQILQTMMVNLDSLPISLFFNTGPRDDPDGNHQNRWVPSRISKDLMTQEHVHKIRFPSGLAMWGGFSRNETLSAFTMDGILPLKLPGRLVLESEATTYTFGPSLSPDDSFVTAGYSSTFIIIENRALGADNAIRRGACFYCQPQQRRSSCLQWVWSTPPRMTFICPLRLQIGIPDQDAPQDFTIQRFSSSESIFINFEPVPHWQRVARNSAIGSSRLHLITGTSTFVIGVAIGAFSLYKIFNAMKPANGKSGSDKWLHGWQIAVPAIFAAIVVTIPVTVVASTALSYEFSWWRYRRSWERLFARWPEEENP
ncbi:hypothetical protein JMJ35_003074 [Cladonia borealis]|uniref:Heterokaryon incompatibility domain-containing protein n=1 Tax=Cladonia borealis TaxID=184061 RepID=A0AA39R417_9LECA|nr:hypothetical protein JMJ35_003074 [Cladonia borealis]